MYTIGRFSANGSTLYLCLYKACAARFLREGDVRIPAIIAAAILLAGCAVAEKIAARNEYEKSAESYRQCMAANPNAPKQCEAQRLAMEQVERKRDSINTDLNMEPGTPPPDYAQSR
jgi:hypothetical protein